MTKDEKLKYFKRSFEMLELLADDIRQRLVYAKEGVEEENLNLIMGGLSGIDDSAQQIKNIYGMLQHVHVRL